MYKIFKGFHLVETYQELKKAKRLAEDRYRQLDSSGAVASSHQRLWSGRPDLNRTTTDFHIRLRHLDVGIRSRTGMDYFRTDCGVTAINRFRQQPMVLQARILPRRIGTDSKVQIHHDCFADPIIMLFIGGFILAIAATKSGLDVLLARVMLKPFGTQSRYVLLGFILVTAFFSMFLSNTATAAMMLTFLTPVLKALPADGKGKIGLALAIPVAANVGGMGTPIGTPPNAIALKYLNDPEGLNMNIGFGEWMSFMMPYTIIVLFIAWFILLRLFPFKQKTIQLQIEGEAQKDWRSIVVYLTFAITVLLCISD